MCSRYALLATYEAVVLGVALAFRPSDAHTLRYRPKPGGEIRPTELAPIVLDDGTVAELPWGLAVDWQAQPVINARCETLDQKPTFRPLLRRRCLVPATGYIEWRKAGKAKVKTRIGMSDGGVFYMAGLTDGERFTIITCDPAPGIAHIHDRMPVIVPPARHARWLDRAQPFAAVRDILAPYAGELAATEETPTPRQGELAL